MAIKRHPDRRRGNRFGYNLFSNYSQGLKRSQCVSAFYRQHFDYRMRITPASANDLEVVLARNDRKGSRTLEESGMKLLRKPFKPASLPFAPVIHPGKEIPSSWRNYCPFLADESRARVA